MKKKKWAALLLSGLLLCTIQAAALAVEDSQPPVLWRGQGGHTQRGRNHRQPAHGFRTIRRIYYESI